MPEKLAKFPNFTRFLPETARLHNKTTRSRPGQGQMSEAEPKFWPQGHLDLEDLTSLNIGEQSVADLVLLSEDGCRYATPVSFNEYIID